MMKKAVIFYMFLFCTGIYAQTEDRKGFTALGSAGLGIGTQFYNKERIQGTTASFDALVGYRNGKNRSFFTGIQAVGFNGGSFLNGEYTTVTSSFLNIPLVMERRYSLSDNISFFNRMGVFGSYHIDSRLETTAGITTEKQLGWNMGLMAELGTQFEINKYLAFSLSLYVQGNSYRLNNNAGIGTFQTRFGFIFTI